MSADHTDSLKIEENLRKATRALMAMSVNVASARQIKEFSSEQRKNLLAKYMAPLIGSMSATAAETTARADKNYQDDLQSLELNYQDAEKVIAQWQATQAIFEAARSLLSHNKELMRQVE